MLLLYMHVIFMLLIEVLAILVIKLLALQLLFATQSLYLNNILRHTYNNDKIVIATPSIQFVQLPFAIKNTAHTINNYSSMFGTLHVPILPCFMHNHSINIIFLLCRLSMSKKLLFKPLCWSSNPTHLTQVDVFPS